MSAGGSEGDIRVAVEAAGTDEAVESIDETEESLNEAGESMDDTAGEMEGMTRKIQGLGMALAASLAASAAGLLSQVPVLGQALGGVRGLVEGVAYQMDQVLRPALEPLTNRLYELSNAVFEADGDMGALIGSLGALGAAIGVAIGALTLIGVTLTAPLLAAIALVAASIAGFALAWKTDFAGIRTTTMESLDAIQQRFDTFMQEVGPELQAFLGVLRGLWNAHGGKVVAIYSFFYDTVTATAEQAFDNLLTALQFFIQVFAGDWGGAWDTLRNYAGRTLGRIDDLVGGAFGDLIEDAYGFGQGLIEEFTDGVDSKMDGLRDTMDNVAGSVRDKLPGSPAKEGPLSDLDQTGPGMVETFASGIEANVGQAGSAATSLAGAADDGAGGGGFTADRGPTNVDVNMDGRRLTQQDSRYRRNGTAQRGRNG